MSRPAPNEYLHYMYCIPPHYSSNVTVNSILDWQNPVMCNFLTYDQQHFYTHWCWSACKCRTSATI